MNRLTRFFSPSFKHAPSCLHGLLWAALVFLFISACSTSLFAQEVLQSSVDSIYYSDLENEQKIEKVSQLINSHDTSNFTPELGHAYHRLGVLYNRVEQYQSAVDKTLNAVRIREAVADTNFRNLNNSLYNVYVYLRKMDRAYEGAPYLNKILEHQAKDKYNYEALFSLATLKAESGDYFAALSYLQTLLQTIDQAQFESIFIRATRKSIEIYSEMPEPGKYIDQINEHHDLLESYELEAEEMVNVNNNLGNIYSKMNDNEAAISYYSKAFEVYTRSEDSIGLGEAYNNLGIQYSILGQQEKARIYFTKGLGYANQSVRAFIYDNQGFFLHPNDPTQRLRLYQKAINTILDKEQEAIDINSLPDLSNIEKSPNRLHILFFLIDKATAWVDLFATENDLKHLIHAKETLHLIDQLVAVIRLDSESDQSKLFWINHGVDSYVLAVKVCFLLNETADAFYFMEKNKSLLLLENLAKANQTKTKFLSTSSLEESLEKHVYAHAGFIEFILNEKEGYGLFCTANNTHFFELNDVPTLITDIARLKKMIERPFTTKDEFAVFDALSNRIFKNLFPFDEALDQLSGNKLTIIPDYELHNLPFELLTTQINEQSFEKNYLINTTEISYLHSCSVDQQIGKLETKRESGMIGFVPTIFENDTLSDLRLSEVEMKEIASFFPSQLALREQATKALFIESLDQYNIIHINSHAGYTQNSTPWLSFYDQKVSLDELTTYPNHSNLVILDACKSALGQQELGEGIMSLARAFFYGGSSSVIASQWQVNEQSSGEIFKVFYKNLQIGMSKSQALHQAKLSYLAANQLSQLSPYYWASFTLTGDAGQIVMEKNYCWMKVLAAVLVALILAFFIYRNR